MDENKAVSRGRRMGLTEAIFKALKRLDERPRVGLTGKQINDAYRNLNLKVQTKEKI